MREFDLTLKALIFTGSKVTTTKVSLILRGGISTETPPRSDGGSKVYAKELQAVEWSGLVRLAQGGRLRSGRSEPADTGSPQ